ncbi:MAG: tetratricopeptide repeat protein [Candidatus Eiseniibacteriota bacterium]
MPHRPAPASRLRRAREPDGATGTILRTKLSPPNLHGLVLERTRLIQSLLERTETPLALLVADAGYGKTTLLTAASRLARRPVIWYSLMASDADPVVFGRHLLAAFRREVPRFGVDFERTLEEVRPGARSAEILGGVLANAVSTLKGPRHLLVLDDFHEVSNDPGVVAMVEALLRHPPARLGLWIASRTAPPLALDRLRARGDAFELDSSQLAFTSEELGRLFDEVYRRPLAPAEIDALADATRGWPTAVHLVHDSLERRKGSTLSEALAELSESPLELHSYLSSEVYARLDEDSRRLLERTAAVKRFDVALAQTLSGLRDAPPRLTSLARRGLLRTFGTGLSASYECHDLVRHFVRSEIVGQGGDEAWRTLEADTARALAARGENERALRHALSAGDVPLASRILRDQSPALLGQGRAATLLEFLGALPAEAIARDLELRLARADAHQALGHWNEAEEDYEAALAIARTGGKREAECHALIGLGKVLNPRGRHEQVLGMAERGLAVARGLSLATRARLLQMKAAAHFYLGQFHAAESILDQVRALLRASPDPELLVPTVHNLAIAYAAQGRYREASREFRAALAQVRGSSSPRAALYLSNLATLLVEMGEVAEARASAEEGLAAAQRFSNRMHETMCHEALAEVLTHAGDLDGALSALKRAEELSAELRMDIATADLLALRGRIFCARGQYRRASEFFARAIEHLSERPDATRLLALKAWLAWCELRAGRPHAARELLVSILPLADAGENDDHRMRVHYWLAEARLALGEETKAAANLGVALACARERGYGHFLLVQAREEPAPLLFALGRAIEIETCAAALVESGPAIEEALLGLLDQAPTPMAEAALSILGEIGGESSETRLPELARARRTLASAIKTALKHVSARGRRGVRPWADESGAPAVRLQLFGPPCLLVHGRSVPASSWRSQRAFHILIQLALHPRGMTRDELLECFWPGRQLAAGRRNFHPTLSYLRRVLPRASCSPLVRDGETYRLDSEYALSCDLWEFERALETSRRAGKKSDAHDRRAALETAAGLAARPLLEGLYGNWADEVQARTNDRVESVLLELAPLRAEQGEIERALEAYRRAVEIDAFRETTRVALIECLIRLGNRRAAVVEAERLRELLRRELGVDPLPETETAIRNLLGSESGTGESMPAAPRGAASRRPRTNSKKISQSTGTEGVAASSQARLKPPGGGSA